MALFICAGCGREINDRESFPQGKERYCRMCNKAYGQWALFLKKLYDEFDQAKAEVKAKKRKEIFGTADQSVAREQAYQTRSVETIKEIPSDVRGRLDRSLLAGDVKRDVSEFDTSLQNEVEMIQKKKGK